MFPSFLVIFYFNLLVMYSLIQDETECKSLLGTLIYLERKAYGLSPKVLDIVMPTGLFGHVEYNVEIKAIPHNSIDNEPRIFTFITRFKEVSNLHKTLSTIHKNLYLKDKYPTFAKAQYFGTSTSETIAERRTHIEAFLQFVLNNETLCKSKAFQSFIENSKEELPKDKIEPSQASEALDQFLAAEKTSLPEKNTTTAVDELTISPTGNVGTSNAVKEERGKEEKPATAIEERK